MAETIFACKKVKKHSCNQQFTPEAFWVQNILGSLNTS
jgi:hypothetical protein